MSIESQGFLRRAAARVLTHVEATMPATHRDWARAMRTEFDYIEGSSEGLRWAFGCLLACYQQRMRLMNRTQLQVSNWVMGLESLLCFGPLTWLWIVSIANFSIVSSEPRIAFTQLVGTAAPIAFYLGLRFAMFRKAPDRTLAFSLVAAFLLVGVALIVTVTARQPMASGIWFRMNWSLLLLLSALPALCCWHMSMQAESK